MRCGGGVLTCRRPSSSRARTGPRRRARSTPDWWGQGASRTPGAPACDGVPLPPRLDCGYGAPLAPYPRRPAPAPSAATPRQHLNTYMHSYILLEYIIVYVIVA